MARFVSGDVVVLPYPFTDFSSAKVRPALVLAALDRGDLILCQITSQPGSHARAVPMRMTDFLPGGCLPLDSFALPHRGVTAHESCVRRQAGRLSGTKLQEVHAAVCRIIQQS